MKKITKYLSIMALACTGLMLLSCGIPDASAASNAVAAAPSANGDATFSYKIDGKLYSWSGEEAFANRATIDANNEIFFTLMSNDPAEKNPLQFGFGIAAAGSTVINWDNMDRFKSSGSNGGNHFANFRLSYPNEIDIQRFNS